MSKPTEAVKVVVRCRPLNSKEKGDGRKVIVDMDVRAGQVKIKNPKGDANEPPKVFTFDQVYDPRTAQIDIFEITAKPIIDAVLDGYNGTIFAYGQTGTGKSHTMEGREEPVEERGIIPNTFQYIFNTIAQNSGGAEYLVRASYLEIYNEEIRDLMGRNPEAKLELKESGDRGVYVRDLTQFVVKNVAEINSVLQVGKKNRMVGATAMNADSSRSHSIFTVTVEAVQRVEGQEQGQGTIRMGKLNLVDLAGSERQSKTGATGDRLKEGIKINLSLTALGNVISALVDGKSGHVPYRDSKLTRLLQDSLGGNTKTVMVANIGPADWNFDETMSTLRYANRAKNIQNKPTVNEDPKDAMLRQYQEEIQRLKEELEQRQGGGGGGGGGGGKRRSSGSHRVVEKVVEVVDEGAAAAEVERIKQQVKAELEARMRESMNEEALRRAREEAEAHARQQLEAALADQSRSEEQRRQLKEAAKRQLADMEALQSEVASEAKEREALEAKISAMESKVLHGGVNLLDKVDELKKRSEDTKRALEVQRRQEEEQQRRLRELQEVQQSQQQQFVSLQEQAAYYGAQIKSQYELYKARQQEQQDLREQFAAEKEDLLDDYRQLTREIKLKNLIIACFIPPEYQDQIMRHCHFDDYDQSWAIECIECAGNAMRALRDRQAQAQEEEQRMQLGGHLSSDADKLQQVYLSYDGSAAQDQTAGQQRGACGSSGRPGSKSGRPGAAGRRSTGEQRPGTGSPGSPGRSGSSRRLSPGSPVAMLKGSSILLGAGGPGSDSSSEAIKAAYPSAKGLVKDTVDPRLRSSRASRER